MSSTSEPQHKPRGAADLDEAAGEPARAMAERASRPTHSAASPRGVSRRWIIFAILAAVVAALFIWRPGRDDGAGRAQRSGGAGGPHKAPVVRAAAVVLGSITERAPYPGELVADAADIAANVGGRLLAVRVRIGDSVRAGQELARIDDTELRRQRDEARAQERAAQASGRRGSTQLAAARRELARTRALLGDRLVSEQQVDSLRARVEALEAEHDAAVAQVGQARARIAVLQQKISDCRIVAPFAGVVANRYKDAGAYLQPGAGVVRLVAGGPLRVRFEVPERDVSHLAANTTITVRLAARGATASGKVAGIGGEVDRDRRIVRVEGVIDGTPAAWLPGMFAEVLVARRAHERVPLVPAEAVVTRLADDGAELHGIFRVEQGRARWVPVRVIGREAQRVAVDVEIAAGTQVLVSGHAELADKSRVQLASPQGQRR